MTFSHALSTNNFGCSKFIVSANVYEGTHTTIAAALTSASSGDTIFIRPGTYTENLTLKAGVNLSAYSCDSTTPNVTISGKASYSNAGAVSISGIRLQTNSDNCLAVTGSSASIVDLTNCYINCTNATGISFSSSSSSAEINLYTCHGDLGTTGIALYSSSSAGIIRIEGGLYTNTGASTTAATNSAGTVSMTGLRFTGPISTSSTGSMSILACNLATVATNTTCLTVGGATPATVAITNSYITSGTASGISVSAGAKCTITGSNVNSTNTNAITGAGTIVMSTLGFDGTSSTINTTTQTGQFSQLGQWKAVSQPCFSAFKSANSTNATGDGTAFTVVCDTIDFDQGSNYNGSTGNFTAPVAGRYLFCGNVSTTPATGVTDCLMQVVTTNRTWNLNRFVPTAGTTTYSGSAIVNMAANDTAKLVISASGTSKTITVAGNASFAITAFSGMLVS